MTRYVHDVVLFVDVSSTEWVDGKRVADGPHDDRLLIRSKPTTLSVRRYIYRPGQEGLPTPDPRAPHADSFFAEIQRLATTQPSRLTLLAHGLPGVFATYPKNGYPGFDGRTMATLLREWGLRGVSRISVIACHGAVRSRLFKREAEMENATKEEKAANSAERDRMHFPLASGRAGSNRFEFPDDIDSSALEAEHHREVALLKGSFGQQFHAALADPTLPNPPVRTEVSARIAATKTLGPGGAQGQGGHLGQGHNLVQFPYQVTNYGAGDGMMTHHAPGSKFVFYWAHGPTRQCVRAEPYPVRDSMPDDSFNF